MKHTFCHPFLLVLGIFLGLPILAADTNQVLRLPRDVGKIVTDPAKLKKPEGTTVAAYVFPNYHASAIHNRLYAPGWTEYVLTRSARPWFPEHQQPRTPLLGELDESKPSTWEVYNDLAAEHGVDAYIWDWYWYDGEPALHEALEQGFLASKNRNRVKFAVMWTNHPWLHPLSDTTHHEQRGCLPAQL